MGLLKRTGTGELCVLEPEHLVGRSPRANLHLSVPYVSSQHASIRWRETRWELKDLGSRNGTTLRGHPINPGVSLALDPGAEIAFGRAEQTWTLVDESPPHPVLVSEDEPGRAVVVDGEVVALPGPQEPWATVYRGQDGSFKLEKEDLVTSLASGLTFELRGQRWRFICPTTASKTSTVDWPDVMATGLGSTALVLKVSSDEEHVELYVQRGCALVDLGSRAHNYVLLYLARRRLSDAAAEVAEGSAGWVHRDDLLSDLKIDREYLNVSIFRIRKQLETAGIADAASIVERRPDSQQLRIGTAKITTERI